MSREIKFRAWDIENKRRIFEGIHVDFLGQVVVINKKIATHHRNLILMQFTGLKDRHGVEIYEGDLLKGNQGNFVVKFELGRYVATFPSGSTIQNLLTFLLSNRETEVIGNIYENPELLEGQSQ